MPNAVLRTFADVLSSFRRHFSAPSFFRFLVLVVGWILAGDPCRCVTEAFVSTGISGKVAWSPFHRFFSQANWRLDALGRTLLGLLAPLLHPGLVELVIDDTLAHKRGGHVFGASMHLDPVSSTKRRRNLVRGHCWVVLAAVVDVPWSKRPWAIPLLFRLYRGKKEAGAAYRSKPALAREMLELALGWLPKETTIRLLLDSGYMNRTMLCGLDLGRVTVVGALRNNAALYRPPSVVPKARGRRRTQGERMATPARMHGDRRYRWTKVTTNVYQRTREQCVLSLQAQWYGVLGALVGRAVIVDVDPQKVRTFFCTDGPMTAEAVLEAMARRWSIEVWNRGIKQDFGFADSPAWSEKAVLRTAPWAGLLSGMLVVWFHCVYDGLESPVPQRPWYPRKEELSFADIVRVARATVRPLDVLAWAREVAGRFNVPSKGFRAGKAPDEIGLSSCAMRRRWTAHRIDSVR